MSVDDRQTDDEPRNGLLSRAARGASERVLDIVDPDMLLEHVDINALLNRIDLDTLLDRVDLNALLDRVDIDALLSRADIDALMERIDVGALVERAGIPQIVAESTSHLTGSALDLFRRPIVGIDVIIFRFLNRLIRRDPDEFPSGPHSLVDWVDERSDEDASVSTGRYGGPLTRLLAVVVDTFIVTTGFTLTLAGTSFLLGLVSNIVLDMTGPRGLWFALSFVTWAFIYLWVSLAIFGKTIGKAVLGVRVVGADGSAALKPRQAFLRVLTYPLSFLIFGIGLLGIIFGQERRAWHDHFAGTAVVYDWGSRTARMPTPLADWLVRRQEESDS